MDAIDALKQKVLTLAIQGKLIPQNLSDEPASELLKKIKAEKEALVKAGKIKKDKQESYIYKDSDNNYYEKIGAETKDITEEIPFEIPNNWEWVRLGTVFNIILGQSPDGNTVNSTSGLEFHQGKVFFGEKYLNKSNQYTTKPNKIAPTNTVLLCVRAPVGIVNITNREICIGRGLAGICGLSNISIDFIYYWLLSLKDEFIKKATGTTFVAITADVIQNQLIPLPPLSEQERIVSEIEKIFAEIEVVKTNQEELSKLKDGLKSKILDLAIQGKLVEQDPTDEPASVLLEKIKAEKVELVKQGKIKKDKQESYIFKGADNRHYEKIGLETKDITEEIPFEIPENWEWARLNTICQINPRNAVNDDVEASFIPMNMIQDGFRNKHSFIVKKWKKIKSGFTHFMNNDIGVAKITPCFENRKSVIFTNLTNNIGSGTTELHILRPYSEILPEYILLLCKTEYFISNGVKNFTGTAGQQRINSQFVKEFLCPLPPLNEQKKVINKVSKMFEIIENL